MATITQFQNRLNKTANEISAIIIETIKSQEPGLVEIQQEQLQFGKLSDGNDITPEYAPLTKYLKQKNGQPTNVVTLRDTGAYYKGMKLYIQDDTFSVISSDAKRLKLIEKYSPLIEGYDQDSIDAAITTLTQPFINIMRKKLDL